MLLQRRILKRMGFVAIWCLSSLPAQYLEHLGKTVATGNQPEQFTEFAPGFHTLPVSSVNHFFLCPQYLHQQCKCISACHHNNRAQRGHRRGTCPLLGNGLRDTWKRRLSEASVRGNCKIIWSKAFLLLMRERSKEQKVPTFNLNELHWQSREGPVSAVTTLLWTDIHACIFCSPTAVTWSLQIPYHQIMWPLSAFLKLLGENHISTF